MSSRHLLVRRHSPRLCRQRAHMVCLEDLWKQCLFCSENQHCNLCLEKSKTCATIQTHLVSLSAIFGVVNRVSVMRAVVCSVAFEFQNIPQASLTLVPRYLSAPYVLRFLGVTQQHLNSSGSMYVLRSCNAGR